MLLSLQPRTTSAIWRSWEKRHLGLHSSTFPWKNIVLLLLLFLSLEQTSASLASKVKQKPGTCPKERLSCSTTTPDLCRIDSDCQDYLKCCSFNCRKRCMDPFREPCMLPVDSGNCKKSELRWYFDAENQLCKSFTYGGCQGNANNFLNRRDCKRACMLTIKKGQCPLFPLKERMQCPSSCKNDFECLHKEKCCESMCGFVCAKYWNVKDGHCPSGSVFCTRINKPQCLVDADCPLTEKCCSRCGLICIDPNTYTDPGNYYSYMGNYGEGPFYV